MRQIKDIAKIIPIVCVLVIVIIFAFNFRTITSFDYHGYINSYGNLAALVYIGIFVLRTLLVFFPYFIVVGLGGNLFGPFYGFIYSIISVFISSTLAFFIARFFGKGFVQKLIKGKVKDLDKKVEKHGIKVFFFMRISALFPFDPLNYAAGLTRVKYRDFIIGSFIGILPETFSITYLGHNISNPFSPKFLIAIALVLLTIAVPFLVRKLRQKSGNTTE